MKDCSIRYYDGFKPRLDMSIDHSSPPKNDGTRGFPGCPIPLSISFKLGSIWFIKFDCGNWYSFDVAAIGEFGEWSTVCWPIRVWGYLGSETGCCGCWGIRIFGVPICIFDCCCDISWPSIWPPWGSTFTIRLVAVASKLRNTRLCVRLGCPGFGATILSRKQGQQAQCNLKAKKERPTSRKSDANSIILKNLLYSVTWPCASASQALRGFAAVTTSRLHRIKFCRIWKRRISAR